MQKRTLTAVALLLITLLAGCAGHSTQMLGSIDMSDKTVATPAGTKGIVGPVKRVLYEEGWQVDVLTLQLTGMAAGERGAF